MHKESKNPSDIDLAICAEAITKSLNKKFVKIVEKCVKRHLKGMVISPIAYSRLVNYPSAMLLAENIGSSSILMPPDNRSGYIMECLNQYQQLIERVVNDYFLKIKEIAKNAN